MRRTILASATACGKGAPHSKHVSARLASTRLAEGETSDSRSCSLICRISKDRTHFVHRSAYRGAFPALSTFRVDARGVTARRVRCVRLAVHPVVTRCLARLIIAITQSTTFGRCEADTFISFTRPEHESHSNVRRSRKLRRHDHTNIMPD